MSVGRNDSCPCGSGKKYKKCCLKKENVIELEALRREQFYTEKQDLVEKVGGFLKRKMPINEYNELKDVFLQRTDKQIDISLAESIFTYWLYFYHTFENGLRGVEWFYEEEADLLDPKAKEMAETWIHLRPRFLQLVRMDDTAAYYEDQHTQEVFPLSRDEENIPQVVPWASTLAMIEEVGGLYYFNGFRMTLGPSQLQFALDQLNLWQEQENLTLDEVKREFFPEITAALVNGDTSMPTVMRDVYQYTVTYSMENPLYVLEYLRSQQDFRIESWADDKKEVVWAGNWRTYHDSHCDMPVDLADVFGQLQVTKEDTRLTFETMQPASLKEMKARLQELGKHLVLVDESETKIGTTSAETYNVMVSMDPSIPQYFALYAQNDLVQEADHPLPVYNDKSLRELALSGEEKKAETWLRHAEYSLYRQVLQNEETVDVTADFNGVRQMLGFELSPFVTGGASRKTNIETIELDDSSPRLMEEDIPYLEELGFTPETIKTFFIGDMLRFYKERTIGKSDATKRKYRHGLSALQEILSGETLEAWEQCGVEFWEKVVEKDYPQAFPKHTKTDGKAFISTVKTFISWLDKVHPSLDLKATLAYIRSVEK